MARSKLRKSTKKVSRARKNPEAWKFAIGIPVAIGAGYLLYKYVFMNEAQAAEMIESGKTPAMLPGTTESGVQIPASGTVPGAASGAEGASGPGGSTTLPAVAPKPAPQFPASGKSCYAGTIAGQSVKLTIQFAGSRAAGVVTAGSKTVAKLVIVPSGGGRLASAATEPEMKNSFKLRAYPFTISDAGVSHLDWTLKPVKC